MPLLLLLLLSVISVLVGAEPFAAFGIFVIICYLPGLSFFYLVRQDGITFKDLLFVFPCSIGISGLFTLAVLSAGIHVDHIAPLISIVVALVAVFRYVSKKKGASRFINVTGREGYFMLFALFIALIMSFPYFIGPNRGFFAAHAYHHSSFVSQMLNGIFPPENPGLGGTRIGYYWGFHAMVAAIAAKTDMHQLQIIFALNAISLFTVFCMTYAFARAYNLPEGYRYIMPPVLTGLIRPDIGLYFISRLASGTLVPLDTIMSANNLSPMEVFGMWLNNLPWYDTRLFLLNKFYNISAMPTAICLCFAYLLMLLFSLGNKSVDRVYSVCLYLMIAGCILIYPPLAIVLLLHAPIWSVYIFVSNKGRLREKAKESLKVLAPYIAGILTVMPYLLYIMASRDISSSGQGGVFSFALYAQSVKNSYVLLIPSPLIIYGMRLMFKRHAHSRETGFLIIGTLLSLTLSLFTRWPFDNSYKFTYILIIFLSLFFAWGLAGWVSSFRSRLLARSVSVVILMLLLLTPVIIEAAYIVSCLSMDRLVDFSNGHMVYAHDVKKNEVYEWIRENTPGNSLLLLGYTETNWPCCGLNSSYEAAAFSERTLYVVKDVDYTVSNPEYAKRIVFRQKLFEDPGDQSLIDHIRSLKRPVFLLLDDTLDREKFFIEERFAQFPPDLGQAFIPLFKNDRQRVYRIQLNEKNP